MAALGFRIERSSSSLAVLGPDRRQVGPDPLALPLDAVAASATVGALPGRRPRGRGRPSPRGGPARRRGARAGRSTTWAGAGRSPPRSRILASGCVLTSVVASVFRSPGSFPALASLITPSAPSPRWANVRRAWRRRPSGYSGLEINSDRIRPASPRRERVRTAASAAGFELGFPFTSAIKSIHQRPALRRLERGRAPRWRPRGPRPGRSRPRRSPRARPRNAPRRWRRPAGSLRSGWWVLQGGFDHRGDLRVVAGVPAGAVELPGERGQDLPLAHGIARLQGQVRRDDHRFGAVRPSDARRRPPAAARGSPAGA